MHTPERRDSLHSHHSNRSVERKITSYAKENGDSEEGQAKHVEIHTDIIDIPDYSPAETKKILRKIDMHLIPLLAFIYLLSFLDRGNIGNAKVAGMNRDLGLVGLQYNVALTVFFIPYALLEVPSNVVLKLWRASRWIALMMFTWGLVMAMMGFVQDYKGLVIARFFLGVTESGFFPAASFLLTIFYKRYEVQTRMAAFYTCASLSGAFSGLLAYGIGKMHGVGNLAGWRWIFILEGILTTLGSILVILYLPDSPETCRFLTQDERNFVVYRLQVETGSSRGRVTNNDRLTMAHIVAGLKEWKIWAAVIMFWGNSICVYGFTFTLPSVILGLGYSAANAQLLTIPIYLCAMIFVVVFAVTSDHYGVRSYGIMLGFGAGACGFLALLVIPHPAYPGLTYGFLFLAATGIYCPQMLVICWIANNLAPSSKRAIGMALFLCIGNCGGIVGSNIFMEREAPKYPTGYGYCLAQLVCAVLMAIFLRWVYAKENRQKESITEEEVHAKYSDEELLDLGDKSPFFRYTL